MDPILKNSIKEGAVSSVNPNNCTARVVFPDAVSYELPILVRGAKAAKDYWLPVPGEQVVCVFLPTGNARGFILGSIYIDPPPVNDENKRVITFADGTSIEYDQKQHKLSVTGAKEISVSAVDKISIAGTKELEINATERISINAPKGVSISSTDITGDGVTITGKDSNGSW